VSRCLEPKKVSDIFSITTFDKESPSQCYVIGLFIIGNMSVLKNVSDLWKRIEDVLIQQNSIGTSLPLQCQVHGTKNEVFIYLKYS
jgi:hypothetical protein